ncbi:MAG: NAD(P)H-dependent oxidoreductase subunit E [Actinobacteria bacterium]|nr:NAD(P)H-dependent oxidoreductase subunit E [Actinomycetota bacterium]
MARNKISEPSGTVVAQETPAHIVRKVDALLEKYTDRAGMVIGLLQDIQSEFNYLPQDVLMYLSAKSEIPLSRLYAVARFYNGFSLKPRGKYIIRVCLGTACHLRGGGQVADAVVRELGIEHGETTKDKLFTLERVNCLGTCALAPVITVNDKYHGKMTVGKMMKVLEECVQEKPEQACVEEAQSV